MVVRYAGAEKNEYFSNNSMQVLVESLNDLEEQIKRHGGKLFKMHVSKTEDERKEIKKLNPNRMLCNCNDSVARPVKSSQIS